MVLGSKGIQQYIYIYTRLTMSYLSIPAPTDVTKFSHFLKVQVVYLEVPLPRYFKVQKVFLSSQNHVWNTSFPDPQVELLQQLWGWYSWTAGWRVPRLVTSEIRKHRWMTKMIGDDEY